MTYVCVIITFVHVCLCSPKTLVRRGALYQVCVDSLRIPLPLIGGSAPMLCKLLTRVVPAPFPTTTHITCVALFTNYTAVCKMVVAIVI